MIGNGILAQIIEDDPAMGRFIRRNLEFEDFRVVVSGDGEWALDQFEDESPDVVILDVGIPKLNGLEVCRHIRASSDVPVIIVTAKGGDCDIIEGLDAGADDYLCKPFSAGVLLSRVNAVLRRRLSRFETPIDRFEIDDLVIDLAARNVTLAGKPIRLTPLEYKLLTLLVRNCGKVLTSPQILEQVWGAEFAAETQILRTNISRLRGKIEPNKSRPTIILTEPGGWDTGLSVSWYLVLYTEDEDGKLVAVKTSPRICSSFRLQPLEGKP